MNNNMNKEEMKACSKCKRRLPSDAEHFVRDKNRRDGLYPSCRECNGLKFKPIENIPKGFKKCTTCNKILKATNEYFAKKKNGKYGLDGRCKKCDAEYRKKHRKRTEEYHRLYYIKNKKVIAERSRKWRKKNRSSEITRKQRRKARKRNLPATLTEKQWNEVKAIFNHKCVYCGMPEREHLKECNEKLHREHFLPVIKGGGFTHNNILPSCRRCNSSKHEKNFFEWYPTYEHYSRAREKKILEYLGYIEEGVQQLSIL